MGHFFFFLINVQRTHTRTQLLSCIIAPSCLIERVSNVAGAPEWAELLCAPAAVATLARGSRQIHFILGTNG